MNHSLEYSTEDYLLHGGTPPDSSKSRGSEVGDRQGLTTEERWLLYGEEDPRRHPLKESLFRRLLTKITAVFQLGC